MGDGSRQRTSHPPPRSISTESLQRLVRPSWWLYLGVAASLGVTVTSLVIKTWRKTQPDLSVYFAGAQHLFDGKLYGVYGVAHLPFTYPPFAALLFWPLTAFAFGTAQAIWLVISVAALVALVSLTLWAVRPELPNRDRWMLTALILGPVFWFEPIEANFSFGQVNILLTLMIMVDLLVLARRDRSKVPTGVLTGIAAAIKLIPLVFVAYLAVTQRLRVMVMSVIGFAAASALALACNPKVTWEFVTKYAFDTTRIGSVFYLSNQSAHGALDRMTHRTLSAGVGALISVVLVIGGLYVARLAYQQGSLFLSVIVTGVTGLLASPITWTHHIVWVIPIVAWLLLGRDRPSRGTWWAGLAVALAWSAPVWLASDVPTQELRENVLQALAGNAYFLALLSFLVAMGVMLLRRGRRGVADAPTYDTGFAEVSNVDLGNAP